MVRFRPHFLAERQVAECSMRFHVLAIDQRPGEPPLVRLHMDAFRPDFTRQAQGDAGADPTAKNQFARHAAAETEILVNSG